MNNKEISDVLQKEQEFLLNEIQNIHNRKISIFKLLITTIGGVVTYLFAGIIFYVKSTVSGATIPNIIGYSYSIIGIFLTLSLYYLVHNLYYHVGPSKKHTVRYWKAIHSIRRKIKELNTQLNDAMIMQDSLSNPLRPRLSGRWDLGVLIYPIYHLLFYGIMIIFFVPFFSSVSESGIVLDSTSTKAFLDAGILILPLLIIKLAIGCRAMRKYSENIALARVITADCIFPKEKHFYEETLDANRLTSDDPYCDRSAKKGFCRGLIFWVHTFITLASIAFTTFYFYQPSLLDFMSFDSVTIIATLISTSIIAEIFYLITYNILRLEISFNDGSMSLCIKKKNRGPQHGS